MIWIRVAETLAFKYVSPAFEQVYGLGLDELLDGDHLRDWTEPILPEDRALALEHLRRVQEGEHVMHVLRVQRPNGQVRWERDTGFPILDDHGRVQRVAGIGHDVTGEIELQDRLRALVAELQHRSRNLFSVVNGLTECTIANSGSLEEIRARLAALGRVDALLSRLQDGSRVTFDQLLMVELQAHGAISMDGQVRLEEPKGIRLRSATVQTIALAIHELATNALKHGALSRPQGRLEVRWGLTPAEGPGSETGERCLQVEWNATGVPLAGPGDDGEGAARSGSRSYGRELIERALPHRFKAQTRCELNPDGVRCTLTVPVSSTLDLAFSSQEGSDA